MVVHMEEGHLCAGRGEWRSGGVQGGRAGGEGLREVERDAKGRRLVEGTTCSDLYERNCE